LHIQRLPNRSSLFGGFRSKYLHAETSLSRSRPLLANKQNATQFLKTVLYPVVCFSTQIVWKPPSGKPSQMSSLRPFFTQFWARRKNWRTSAKAAYIWEKATCSRLHLPPVSKLWKNRMILRHRKGVIGNYLCMWRRPIMCFLTHTHAHPSDAKSIMVTDLIHL